MEFSDEQLVLLYGRGRQEAFEELYHRYSGPLYAYLARLSRNVDVDAADLLQETFLRVARAAPDYRPTARFSTWLYRIATNCFLNARKTVCRRGHLRLLPRRGGTPDPPAVCELRAGLNELERAISALPEGQQTAFLLRQTAGLSYEAIADVVGEPVTTVKTHIHRARVKLVRELRPYLSTGKGM